MSKLCDKRYEEIKEIVVKLLCELDIHCVPISGFEVAKKLGITFIPYSSFSREEQDVLCKRSNMGFALIEYTTSKIFYNDRNGYGCVNNTLIHEVAHIVLGHLEESDIAEQEAKFFAKYLLAPPVLIHELNLTTVNEISERFGISYQAADYALGYYNKWLNYGERDYTNYEIEMCKQFNLPV